MKEEDYDFDYLRNLKEALNSEVMRKEEDFRERISNLLELGYDRYVSQNIELMEFTFEEIIIRKSSDAFRKAIDEGVVELIHAINR